MTISAFDGPLVTFPALNTTGITQSNPEAGPSVFIHGLALADPRTPQYAYVPGKNFGQQVSGWLTGAYETIDQAPSTASVSNIAAAQTAVANTPLALTATTGITSGVSIIRADTGAVVTGLLAIDSVMTTVTFGQQGSIRLWDPTTAISRNIRVSSNGADQTGVFTVRGFDLYGFPMTEAISGSAGTATTAVVASGVKAWKYVASVTPSGTVNSTGLTVGTGDTIGLPLRADRWTELLGTMGNTSITAAAGFTAAVTTTATATSGDVRGTYALQTASNGVLRFTAKQSPQVNNATSLNGLVGVNQFTS